MALRLTINWRFLIFTTVVLVAGLGVLNYWHSRQVKKQIGVYLREADLARDRQEPTRETAYLERYLRSKPNDLDTRERLARLYANSAKTPRQIENAHFLLEDLLRRDRDRDDLRRFTLEFVMEPRTALILEAKEHLEILAAKFPKDADIQERYGTYFVANRKFDEAKRKFKEAYLLQPDRLTAYAGHAMVLRDQDQKRDEADAVVEDMLKRNAVNYRAYLFAMDYGRRYGEKKYVEKINEAIRLAPDERDVILAQTDWLRDQAREARPTDKARADEFFKKARTVLQKKEDLLKTDLAFPLALAAVAAEAESPVEAAKILHNATLHFTENEKLEKLLTTLVEYQIQVVDHLEVQKSPTVQAVQAVQETLDLLNKHRVPVARLAFHQARLSMAKREWVKANRELQKILADHPDDPAFVRAVNYHIGLCFEQVGETDRRLEAFSRSIPDDVTDPLWIKGHQGLADTYAAIGRADESLRIYKKLSDQAPLAWLAIAKLQILLAHRENDPPETKWNLANEAVARCQIILNNLTDHDLKSRVKTEIELIKADLLSFQNKKDEAVAIADRLFREQPKNPIVLLSKAFLNPDVLGGVAFLEKARKEHGDTVQFRIAQSQLLAGSKLNTINSALSALAEDVSRFSIDDQRRLFYGLAEAATVAGFPDLADQFWDRVVTIQPDDYFAHLIRFDRAWHANDDNAMTQIHDKIVSIDDGNASVASRLMVAFQLIRKGKGKGKEEPFNESKLNDALDKLDQLERERPNLTRVIMGKAMIYDELAKHAEKSNVKDHAKILKYSTARLDYFRRAFNQGETQPLVLHRLTELLFLANLNDEANSILRLLVQNEQLTDPTSLRLAADVFLRSDNPKQAVAYALRAITPDSKEPSGFIWKGQILWATSDRSGALTAFHRAAELKPEDPQAWLLLIECYKAEQRTLEIQSTLEKAREKIRPEEKSLFLAQAYKLTDQIESAKTEFEKARRERPSDDKVLRAQADFLMLIGDWPAAEKAWKDVIQLGKGRGVPEEEINFAQNMVQICIAFDPNYERARTVVTVLGLDQKGLTNAATNISPRTQAIILSLQRDRNSKLEAIKLFEKDLATLNETDKFLLAHWYIQVNKIDEARHTLSELLSRPPSDRNSHYLSFFVGWLLDIREPNEAARWLEKLDRIEPNTPRTIGLKIRTLAGTRKVAEARKLLNKQTEKSDAKLNDLAQLAELAKLDSDAEDLFKRYVEQQRGKEPDAELQLAGFYARRGRLADALRVCESAWNTTSRPEAVGQLCIEALSSTPKADPALLTRVEGWLVAAQAKHPQSTSAFQQQLAFVKNLQGQYDDTIRLLGQLCANQDANPTDLNNLAYLLSARKGQYDAALNLIARAKAIEPQNSELLDTESLILLARGTKEDLKNARERLLHALSLAQIPKGSFYFHLAQVEAQDEKVVESIAAWRDAERLNLKPSELHPLELDAYNKMKTNKDYK